MNIKTERFRIKPGEKVDLNDWPTEIEPVYESKHDYEERLNEQVEQLADLQRLFYAADTCSLLLIFQAMDAAGKDGAIRHVMSGVNPQGCQVFSFKKPSAEELDHDFLWRTSRCLPERGRIGIFNRSYYEEVIIVRVRPELLDAQKLPNANANDPTFWRERYESIVDHEKHLHRNGTRILKFFLHVSKGEQRKRFLKRIDEPDKNWKFNADDVSERARWNSYMNAYEDCLAATCTEYAPWFAVPADDKKNTRLIISQIILDAMHALDLSYPQLSPEQVEELHTMRERLERDV